MSEDKIEIAGEKFTIATDTTGSPAKPRWHVILIWERDFDDLIQALKGSEKLEQKLKDERR